MCAGVRLLAIAVNVPHLGTAPDTRLRGFRPPIHHCRVASGSFTRGPREIRLSAQTLSQFDETDTNAFYFAIWSREGTLLKHSTNAPS